MSRADAVDVSLIKPDELVPVLTNEALADGIRLRIASARLSRPIAIEGLGPLALTFNAGAELSVIALTDKTGSDDDGIVGKTAAAGDLSTPLLEAGSADAWLKYVCNAEVRADARFPLAPARFAGGVSASATLAEYRHHTADTGIATAVAADLAAPRVAAIREHIVGLPERDALIFGTRGELSAAVEVEWSDVLTSEIGSIARLLDARGPVAV